MEKFKVIDSIDVTFADSFARKELKVDEVKVHKNGEPASKGTGEKRIYCGHDENALNKFFGFEFIDFFVQNKESIYNDQYTRKEACDLLNSPQCPLFFIEKEDLVEYYDHIKQEYNNPSYAYGGKEYNIKEIYREYGEKLKNLKDNRLYFRFYPKYDTGKRYYLKLPYNSSSDKEAYSFIQDICLPRVSRLLFIRLQEIESERFYIYLKPFYGTAPMINSETQDQTQDVTEKEKSKEEYRKHQESYRNSIFDYYPYCVVTKVTDPSLLIACHIKGYANCKENEKYDEFNGLTMTPTIHYLFDLGYLTFDMEGNMMLSDFFRNMDRRCLNLQRQVRIDLREDSKKYLEWHNENVFIRTSKGIQIVND